MPKRVVPLAAALLAVAVASGARADTAFYVGASFVQTDSEFETAVDNFEADDSSFKIFGGFNFIKWVGVEASYRDLGTHSDTSGADSIDVDIEAFDVNARGILPLGKVIGLFGKVGYGLISTDGSLDVGGSISDFDEDDWELMYGAGVDVYIFKRLGLRAEWEEYDVEDSLNSLSVGAFFRF
jgi:OOP family OmpA-OmpF porin